MWMYSTWQFDTSSLVSWLLIHKVNELIWNLHTSFKKLATLLNTLCVLRTHTTYHSSMDNKRCGFITLSRPASRILCFILKESRRRTHFNLLAWLTCTPRGFSVKHYLKASIISSRAITSVATVQPYISQIH